MNARALRGGGSFLLPLQSSSYSPWARLSRCTCTRKFFWHVAHGWWLSQSLTTTPKLVYELKSESPCLHSAYANNFCSVRKSPWRCFGITYIECFTQKKHKNNRRIEACPFALGRVHFLGHARPTQPCNSGSPLIKDFERNRLGSSSALSPSPKHRTPKKFVSVAGEFTPSKESKAYFDPGVSETQQSPDENN
jgi:hypothetical protein